MNMDFKLIKMEAGKKAILDAADRCILDGNPLQIASVADKAEIATGTVYRYFKDKQHLEDELVARMLVEMTVAVEQEVSRADPPEARLDSMLRAICDAALKHAGALQLFLAQATWSKLGTDHDASGEAKDAYQLYCNLESDILQSLTLNRIPGETARLFLRASVMSGLLRLASLGEHEQQEGIDAIIRLTVHGLLGCDK